MKLHPSVTIPPNLSSFFKYATEYADAHLKKIDIRPCSFVKIDSARCAGYCDGNSVVVARRNPLFASVLSHEVAHLQQSVEEIPLWENCRSDIWWDMQTGKVDILSWDSLLDTILLERDCEERSIKFGQKFGIFNVKEYTKRANAYLFFYHFVFLKKEWVNSTTIYQPEILERMPDYLLPPSRFSFIDMDLMKIYNENL